MIVEPAERADMAAIGALERAGFDHARWSDDAWAEELAGADRHVLVARDAGDVVGVATFSVAFETAELLRVIVRPDRRGEGIAHRLIDRGIGWARDAGADRLMLEVEVGNAPARYLYDALGFETLARRTDYYGEGRDALVMSLGIGAHKEATCPVR